jgi:hypothetical protein
MQAHFIRFHPLSIVANLAEISWGKKASKI